MCGYVVGFRAEGCGVCKCSNELALPSSRVSQFAGWQMLRVCTTARLPFIYRHRLLFGPCSCSHPDFSLPLLPRRQPDGFPTLILAHPQELRFARFTT